MSTGKVVQMELAKKTKSEEYASQLIESIDHLQMHLTATGYTWGLWKVMEALMQYTGAKAMESDRK